MTRADRRPRIALVLPGFAADEEDSCIPVLSTYVRTLSESTDVTVFTAGWPFRPGRYSLHGASVYCTARGRTNRVTKIRAWLALERAIVRSGRLHPFDRVDAFWATSPGYAAVRAAHRLGVPSQVSIAGGELVADRESGYGSMLSPISRRVVRTVLSRADTITLGSRYLLDLLPQRYHTRSRIAPLGIDTDLFVPQQMGSRAPDEPLRLLTVGAIIPIKGYRTILHGLAELRSRGIEARLTGLGWKGDAKEMRRIEGLIDRLGLAGSVELRGTIEHRQMPKIYGEHDLLVQGSRHEAQGMAVIEAMACGLPVISTPVGIVPDIDSPLLSTYPIGDSRALADRVTEMISRPTLDPLGEATRIAREFDARRCTARILGMA